MLCAQYLTDWGGQLHDRGGDVALCEAIFRESLAMQAGHSFQPANEWHFSTLWWLAYICEQDGRIQEGERLALEAVSVARAFDGGDGWTSADAASLLGACLIGQGRYAEAEPLLVSSALSWLKLRSITTGSVRRACYRVRDLYALWGDPRNAEAVWRGILRQAVDGGLRGSFIDETARSVVAMPGLDAGTYGLARDYVSRELSGPRSDEERRRLLTPLLLSHLRTGAYEEVRSILPELEAGSGGATAVEWAAYAMALGELGETDEAADALGLARDLLAEGGTDAAATRWVAEAEAALR
ncbi:MAG: tetratricopeptide repeat protein [Planctomycetota bacterium]|nr:MAG: tetratricopeptide repeat protein [Planctomycetota bacterium]